MRTIAIIGAGFSGTLTALNLLSINDRGPLRIILYESRGRFGPGLAYSTRAMVHYLNVPAGNMSAWERDPQHFLRWLRQRSPDVSGGSFVSRGCYGDYLREQLESARDRFPDRLELRASRVTSVRRADDGRMIVESESGQTATADRVVLALGNFPSPAPPGADAEVLAHPGYIHNPWQADAIDAILPDEPVLIIGTGLSMVDIVMQLHAREHAGRITALSRHGLLPRPHRSPARPPARRSASAFFNSWDGTARQLVRILREAVRAQAAQGVDWRDVIASLRPMTGALWQRLNDVERARFLSRLRSYWEVVRHRAAPESAAAIADLIAARQLSIRAGRVLSLRSQGRLIVATFRPRRSENTRTIVASRVINCLGPQTDLHAVEDSLVRQLLNDGLVTADPHGLGMNVSTNGEAIARGGVPDPALLVVGPLRKGQHWESTAVPELRKQAAEVARACLTEPVVVTNVSARPATSARPTSPG